MSVFVDTGVFYAHHDRDSGRHETSRAAFERVLDGELGRPYTSDYVYDETVTLMRSRTGDVRDAIGVGRRIRGVEDSPDVVGLLHVSEDAFAAAVDVFERYDDQPLSFTDATTVALVDRHDVDSVLSFDDDFDGVVDRIAPADLTGRSG